MKRIKYGTILLLGLTTILVSCNSYQKLLKSDDIHAKYEKAKEFFNEKQYNKALLLLEDVIPYYKASTEYEKVNYLYAYCQMALGNNLIAAHRFKVLYDTYPFGEFSEQSLFNYAYCYYLDSPPIELDQTYSKRAIEAFQLFINRFPESDKIADCNGYMDKLYNKLEQKEIHIAKLYYKVEQYKAAIWVITSVLEKYPLTAEKNELQFLVLDSYFKLSERSVESKKMERFNNTIEYYESNRDVFVNTEFATQAENIYKDALNHVKKHN